MNSLLDLLLHPAWMLFCILGSVLGLFAGAVPGLSVTMATALLVSLTYTWKTEYALAMIMGVYVTGVFSGALSAILLNIPGAPSSVATTLDGYPMAKRGEAERALSYAAIYSFTGGIFGLAALFLLAKPVSAIALSFWPMDYFLLALLGLTTIGALSGNHFLKGLLSAACGLFFSLTGLHPVLGTPRLTFGIRALNAGIPVLPALIGLFGLAEALSMMPSPFSKKVSGKESTAAPDQAPPLCPSGKPAASSGIRAKPESPKEMLRFFPQSLIYSLTGMLIGALPGAGSPVASLLAYAQAKRLVRQPSRPFGEGAPEGIIASESANNACIGGALIPTLTLGVPGDAVTAVMLAAFTVHGLQPGPLFLANNRDAFAILVCAGLLGCVCLLLLGLFVAPRLAVVLRIPRVILTPLIALFCVFGAFSGNGRVFDVFVMVVFGFLGYLMRRFLFPVAPMTLALVLGKMMDANLRRALSLASSADAPLLFLFARPVTLVLCVLLVLTLSGRLGKAFTAIRHGRP